MNLPSIKKIHNILTPYESNVYYSLYIRNKLRNRRKHVYNMLGKWGNNKISFIYNGTHTKVILYRGRAIKLIMFDKIKSEPYFTKMFLESINFIKSTDLGAIISSPVYDYTLKECVESNSPLTDHQIKKCIREVGKCMVHMHSLSCYHNDIKPENIMHFDGRWILIDFGLTCNWDMINSDKFNMLFYSGTKHYMPPTLCSSYFTELSSLSYLFFLDKEKCFLLKDWYAFCKTCILCFPYYSSEFIMCSKRFIRRVDVSRSDSFRLIQVLYSMISRVTI